MKWSEMRPLSHVCIILAGIVLLAAFVILILDLVTTIELPNLVFSILVILGAFLNLAANRMNTKDAQKKNQD